MKHGDGANENLKGLAARRERRVGERLRLNKALFVITREKRVIQ